VLIAAAAASVPLLAISTLGGLGGGLVAVWLAQNVPPRMEIEDHPRPHWWWGIATGVGGLYGWLVADALTSRAVIPAFIVFGSATLALTLIDLDHQLIPNRVLFPAIGIAGVLLTIGAIADGASAALLRGVAGGGAYFVGLLAFALVARGGFGMGDVKLALLLGLFIGYIGWGELALGAVLAVLLGGIASALLLVSRTKGRDARFAYGPYLVAGAWVSIIWGERILEWYLR
jgi:prepilin signal peptidase PulO-like enzyme (type II secretory pathway)